MTKEQLNKLMARISFEIRTPLNGILGFAELLKDPRLTPEQQLKFIGIIEKSGERMLGILNNLINISKMESGEIQVQRGHVNLQELMTSMHDRFKPIFLNRKPPVKWELTMPGKPCVVHTDRQKLAAILENLVKNAEKFTSKGKVELGFTENDDHVECFVSDTGAGIPVEMQQAVFAHFRSDDPATGNDGERKAGGLGLAISRAYVELLGGEMRLKSEPGRGSVFSFTLPLGPDPGVDLPAAAIATEGGASGERMLKILIAEDDLPSVEVVKYMLEGINHELIHVKTGEEAIEACRASRDIDLVLMDIRMPGMDGYEATRMIRQFNREVPIIAQTAHALYGDREKALNAGCNDYIAKPIKRQTLRDKVRQHCI